MIHRHHAASLALLGWYLIVPPTAGNSVRGDLPFGKWENAGSFDTATECRGALIKLGKDSEVDIQNALRRCREEDPVNRQKCGDQRSMTITYQNALERARCIASDDPRLKGK
jgi:hypothetical protein